MVAEAIVVHRTLIVAPGFEAPITLVGFGKKGGIVNVTFCGTGQQRWAYQNVVEAAPSTVITIGAFSAPWPFCLSRKVDKAVR